MEIEVEVLNSLSFTGKHSWDAVDIAQIEGATVRLHWTDKPYIWHKNDGDEIFVVLDGQICMHYLDNNIEYQTILNAGDICYLQEGEEHVAYPQNGAARILVVEKKGSI